MATGVRISWEAVEINSVCSPSSSSSAVMLRKVIIRFPERPSAGSIEMATGMRLLDLVGISMSSARSRGRFDFIA